MNTISKSSDVSSAFGKTFHSSVSSTIREHCNGGAAIFPIRLRHIYRPYWNLGEILLTPFYVNWISFHSLRKIFQFVIG